MAAVECRGVAKRFWRYEHRTTTLREFFVRAARRRPVHVRRAHFELHDVSFSVAPGESVALVGRNGAGKSTLLRLVAGVYAPTAGSVVTRGRVASVLELGAGFHGDLTGRENITLWGAMLGIPRDLLARREERLLDFAGLGDFIDEPVKYWSSGMQARLAYAVAATAEPDVLLLDEALAVGDQDFRARCLDHLARFRAAGGTLLVVSHDPEMLRTLCDRVIWLHDGTIRMDGDAASVLDRYAHHR